MVQASTAWGSVGFPAFLCRVQGFGLAWGWGLGYIGFGLRVYLFLNGDPV